MQTLLTSLLTTLAAAGQKPPRARRSDLFADTVVTDQFGQRHRFLTELIRDRAVVINTMFTVCRGSCPGTSETLQRLREPLGLLFGKRVTLLSLSIDPARDNPEVLQRYADLYGAGKAAGAGQPDWLFLSAGVQETEVLRRSLGFYDLNARIDGDISRHAALLLFGNDRANRWSTSPAQIRDGLIWEPLRRVLGDTPAERFGITEG
jgi:protein SCO1/2